MYQVRYSKQDGDIYIGGNSKKLSYFPLRRPKPETDEGDLVTLILVSDPNQIPSITSSEIPVVFFKQKNNFLLAFLFSFITWLC